jgi:tetraacyldisaccharide 4'-kinase
MCLKALLTSIHYQPWNPLLWLLWPLEAAYSAGVKARQMAFNQGLLKSEMPDVPVISIGNLTTGGTGKTPIVLEIARGLVKAGKTVVILSRGYGAKEPVAYGRAMDPSHGDEAYLLQEQVPEAAVIVGKNRVETLKHAVRDYRPDFVLLDDGYQYLRLNRTVNIVLIDGEKLFGNEHMLPLGPLREPLEALKRADLIFVTKLVSPESMKKVEAWSQRYVGREVPVLPVGFQLSGFQPMTNAREMRPVSSFRGQPVVALSGIAQPERFERDLESVGANILKHFRFDDHHSYTANDAQKLKEFLTKQPANTVLVTTDKDRIKLQSIFAAELQEKTYVLKVAPSLDGQWFYHEFLTQMPALTRLHGPHVGSSR